MFVLEEGEGFEGVVSPLHDIGDNQGEVQEQNEIHLEDEPQEKEIAGEANNYENYPNNEEFEGDPNINEYQQEQENDGGTKMHRTRGSGRSVTGQKGERARTPGSRYEMGNTRNIQESTGHLKQIVSSKNHIIQLTRDGYVFSYGNNEFSVSGHGGSKVVDTPQILKHLSDKRVVQIACGESHSIILTDKNDVYTWGRGYEGQLGVSNIVEIASKPNYVKAFFNNPIIFIAAGAFYSLAITHENKLYGWGEARMGQLGLGIKARMVKAPTHIPVERIPDEDTITKSARSLSPTGEDEEAGEVKIIYCSAGLGHTMAISIKNELYTWGFNNCGQLGLGDQVSRWTPVRVTKDNEGKKIPQFMKVVCSYYSTYGIAEQGKIYSWGKGYIGHDGLSTEFLPKIIDINTKHRYFTDVFCNKDMVGFYAPILVFSVFPNCGPVQGGTLLSILGTGLLSSNNYLLNKSQKLGNN